MPGNRSDKLWDKLAACRRDLTTLTWCISKITRQKINSYRNNPIVCTRNEDYPYINILVPTVMTSLLRIPICNTLSMVTQKKASIADSQ